MYSPDLVATQEEYLIAKRGETERSVGAVSGCRRGARSLLDSTRQRLRLWDISDEQIKKLDETGKVERRPDFLLACDRFRNDRKAFPQTAVTPDTELYKCHDLSSVWATADIFEYEVPFVTVGQTDTFR